MKRIALCAFAAVALVAAGCGDDDDSGSGDAKEVALEFTGTGKKPTIEAPESVDAGLATLTLKNSTKKDAGFELVRIEGDHTAGEVTKAGEAWGDKGKALPDWLKLVGGVGSTRAGASKSVTQLLEPGKYLAVDINTDASAPIEVKGDGGGAAPSADQKITAVDYSFQTSGLKAGKQEVLFENNGKQPHFIAGAPIKPGKTLDDVKKAINDESGPPPFDEKAGFDTAVIDGGGKQVVNLELKKGKYAFLCFIPDRQGGPPHVAKGMISEGVVE